MSVHPGGPLVGSGMMYCTGQFDGNTFTAEGSGTVKLVGKIDYTLEGVVTGDDIHIELRDGDEIRTMWYEKPMAPEGVKTYNPSFDVTPAKYITAVITEKGIARPPYTESLAAIMKGGAE